MTDDPFEDTREEWLAIGMDWSTELVKLALADKDSFTKRVELVLANMDAGTLHRLLAEHDFEDLVSSELEETFVRTEGSSIFQIAFLPYYVGQLAAFEAPDPLQLDPLLTDLLGTNPYAEFARTKLSDLLPTLDHSAFRFDVLRRGPSNWHDLDPSVSIAGIARLADRGIPIAWVPSSKTIKALATARPEEHRHILEQHSVQILESCRKVLADVRSNALAEQTVLAREAIDAAQARHFGAAQALASSVFDTTLRLWFDPAVIGGRGYYKKVLAQLLSGTGGTDDQDWKEGPVLAPVSRALEEYLPSRGDPIPEVFNRHASSHAAGRIQYTLSNSLVALMLCVSLLRQVQERTDAK